MSAAAPVDQTLDEATVKQVVKLLHDSVGRGPYPGFKPDLISSIRVTTGETGKSASAAYHAKKTNANYDYETANNLKSYADTVRPIFIVHLTLNNRDILSFTYDREKSPTGFNFHSVNSEPKLRSLFANPARDTTDTFKKTLGIVIGKFLETGTPSRTLGGRRRRSRRRSMKHRKTKRRS